MARNIEIKARVANMAEFNKRVIALASGSAQVIRQDDTFFNCNNGRLKLRAFEDGTGQLIFYRRDDDHGPKESFYVLSQTDSPDSLRNVLAMAYGQAGRVLKTRTLYVVGRTRVHLDSVEGLGHFMELEVVLEESEGIDAGIGEAGDLMRTLGIKDDDLVRGAYLDLLRGVSSKMLLPTGAGELSR